MGEVLKKFGRYFLLDHLAQGGMAEIYRARMASVDGGGRLIVIKRIQAGFGSNKEFLQMFKSEIKVTMGFNHPNIVQLYDFGEENQQPFIAMEFVDGKNLRQIVSRFSELKQTFPIDLAAYITEQAASGLHYAHSFKDKISGTALNIVHRDISPQNILISFEGSVKVIDFGIAKATTNVESTRAGVIKGKPSYLSPEQISGEALDGRSDIFALGAVLWEMLTGRKLFAGENDLAVLKLIESCQTHVKPPSTLNPKVPKELDYIVLKTLAKQREKRYQTAEELQRALHKFLYAFHPEFNPSDLSYYAKDLFKNEIVEDRKKIQKLNEKVEQLISSSADPSAPGNSSNAVDKTKREEDATVVDSNQKANSSDNQKATAATHQKIETLEIEALPPSRTPEMPTNRSHTSYSPKFGSQQISAPIQRRANTKPQSSSSFIRLIAVSAVALIVASIFGPEFGFKVPVLSDSFGNWIGGSEARIVLEGHYKGVKVAVNGETVANKIPATLGGLTVGTLNRISVSGPQGSFQQEITLRKGEKKVITVVLNHTQNEVSRDVSAAHSNEPLTSVATSSSKSILLRLNISPAGGSPNIQVNGKYLDSRSPTIQVPLDAPLELSIDRNGYKTLKREFVLESNSMNGLKEWLMDIQMDPLKFGLLTIHTTPSADATIMIEGSPWKKKTPIENEKIAIGDYSIRLSNDVLGMEKNVNVTIQEGKSVTLDERLEIRN